MTSEISRLISQNNIHYLHKINLMQQINKNIARSLRDTINLVTLPSHHKFALLGRLETPEKHPSCPNRITK
jgi:hypothetical protein